MDYTVGDGNSDWVNTANLLSTSVLVTCQNDGADSNSPYLVATNYGFSIPAGTIDGIEVELYQIAFPEGPNPDAAIVSLKLVKGGVISGTDLSDGWVIAAAATDRTYGDSNNLWGLTLAPADVNASNFGVALQISTDRNNDVTIDSLRITVYYTPS